MHIRSVKIENFRSFYKTEVNLQEGLNVIIGENNTGKSNFITLINLLSDRDYKGSINDFNMSFLKARYMDFLSKPPIININYRIEHVLDYDKEDSAMSKLMPFLIYNDKGVFEKVEESEQSRDKENLIAAINAVYEFDVKYIDSYKKAMVGINSFNDFICVLKKFENYFSYNFKNVTSNDYVDKIYVYKIFEIEKVEAVREINKITTNSRRFLNQKFKDQKIEIVDVANKITSLVKDECKSVTNIINTEIEKDQDNIGVINGKNRFISDFEYTSDLTEMFKYELNNVDGDFRLPLDNNGLGYNNLIYIRNLIKEKKDNDYNILLIEEPEAHLHPGMQYKLLKFINTLKSVDLQNEITIRNQIFVTTHSTNISASVDFESMIIFYSSPIGNLFNISTKNIIDNFLYSEYKEADETNKIQLALDENKKHLEKFLDVTRSDLLFSSKIILVEGIAEKLLIPAMFPELVDCHVSVVEVAGINFNHFIPICVSVGKKVLCISDRDFAYFKDEEIDKDGKVYHCKEFIGLLNLAREKEKQKHYIDAHFTTKTKDSFRLISQISGGNTFETELFIENYDSKENFEKAKFLMNQVCPKCLESLIMDLSFVNWQKKISTLTGEGSENTKKTIKKYLDMFANEFDISDSKEVVEKYFFTTIFYQYAKEKKGELALSLVKLFKEKTKTTINIPKYIEKGIKEWLMQ